jgi:hypothetical protein
MTDGPHPTWTLEHAKNWLRERFQAGEATPCPCCNQTVKMYRRKLNRNMAAGLLLLYRTSGTEFADTSRLDGWRDGERQKLRWWGLIEGSPTDERATWRVTDRGVGWLTGGSTVKSHVLLYNSKCLGLDGNDLTFPDALGEPFDLAELLAERPPPPPTDNPEQMFPDSF